MRGKVLIGLLGVTIASWLVVQYVVFPIWEVKSSNQELTELMKQKNEQMKANQAALNSPPTIDDEDGGQSVDSDNPPGELENRGPNDHSESSDDASDGDANDAAAGPKSAAEKLLELRQSTEQAYARQDYPAAFRSAQQLVEASPSVRTLLWLGDASFFAGEFSTCVETYDRVIDEAPMTKPQLWQRGLALYYAERFADGVEQFESHQELNTEDVENAVWHLLCAARVEGLEKARKNLIPIRGDTRIPMKEVYELFAGRMEPEQVLKTARETGVTDESDPRNQLQRYFAHLYIGLYHEMQQEPDQCRQSMTEAARICPLGKDNFMGQVARVHLAARPNPN